MYNLSLHEITALLHDITPYTIHSVKYGFKTINGTTTDQKSIIFSVTKKKNLKTLSPNEIIPKTIVLDGQEYLTDVEEIPDIADVSLGGGLCAPDPQRGKYIEKVRPLQGGLGISADGSMSTYNCTLGGFFVDQQDGSLVALSVAHALVPNPFLNHHKYGLEATQESATIFKDLKMESLPNLIAQNNTLFKEGIIFVDSDGTYKTNLSKAGLASLPEVENTLVFLNAPTTSSILGSGKVTLYGREKFISVPERDIEDIGIFQPPLKFNNNQANKIGYLKRYYPLWGLQRLDPRDNLFSPGTNSLSPLNAGYGNPATLEPLTMDENIADLKYRLQQYAISKYGTGDIRERTTRDLILEGYEAAVNSTGFKRSAPYLYDRNYIDAAIVAIDTTDPEFIKQFRMNNTQPLPVATTYEIDNLLLGANVFINGSSRGFRGSENENDNCAIYCDAIGATLDFRYPNPYKDFKNSSLDLTYNIKRSRFALKIATRSLEGNFQKEVDDLWKNYGWKAEDLIYYDHSINPSKNTQMSVWDRYLQSEYINRPHPDPAIEKYILDVNEENESWTSRPVPITFNDIISFRYRAELSLPEQQELGLPPFVGFKSAVPQFNVVGPGDSGALMIAEINGVKKIVGMVMGAQYPWRNRGFAMRIDRIMDRLDLAPWDGDLSKVSVKNTEDAEYIIKPGVLDGPVIFENGKKYWQLNTVVNTSVFGSNQSEAWQNDVGYLKSINSIGATEAINTPIAIQKIMNSRYVSFTPESKQSIGINGLIPGQSYKFRVKLDIDFADSNTLTTENSTIV